MLTKFLHEEDGAQVVEYRAQVVEYALIIAMVSLLVKVA